MIGGAQKIQKMFTGTPENIIVLFCACLAIILIRAYAVQLTYNIIWPKVVTNTGGNNSQFTPLTYYESLMIVLLFSFLFGK